MTSAGVFAPYRALIGSVYISFSIIKSLSMGLVRCQNRRIASTACGRPRSSITSTAFVMTRPEKIRESPEPFYQKKQSNSSGLAIVKIKEKSLNCTLLRLGDLFFCPNGNIAYGTVYFNNVHC